MWDRNGAAAPEGFYGKPGVVDYGGFYVSRFELGWQNNTCISKMGVQPWTPSQNKAMSSIKNNFIKTSFAKTCLVIESYYDTIMAFVNGKITKGRTAI